MKLSECLSKLRVKYVGLGLVLALSASPIAAMSAAGAADSLDSKLTTHYDPSVVRNYSIEFEPLAGWEPARDWAPNEPDSAPVPWCLNEDDPAYDGGCWENWTQTERDAWIAAHPELSTLAQQAAWDVVRFDLSNSVILPATFVELGQDPEMTPLRVGVRRKSSRALPSESDPQKVALKIGFNDFVSGQTFRGVTKLSLENGGDVSVIQEGIAWQLHQAASEAGLYGENYGSALSAWVTTEVNGQSLGVFTSVEQRNKQFLRNRGLWTSPTTWLYKQDDIGMPELDEGPNPSAEGIQVQSPQFEALCFFPFRPTSGAGAASCQQPSDGTLDDLLDATIDMDTMLTEAAVDAFLGNHDSIVNQGKNFFFIDRAGEKRRYYPWDLDAVFRSPSSNIYSTAVATNKRGVSTYQQSPFQQLILNHPKYRSQYNAIMQQLLAGPLSGSRVENLFATIQPSLTEALVADPFSNFSDSSAVSSAFSDLQAWIATRSITVASQVTANLPAPRKADSTAPTVTTSALSSTTILPGAEFTISASATDASEVVRLEYRIGSDAWAAMTPSDGAFGGTSEAATATGVSPLSDGSYQVCVRAWDGSENISPSRCATLTVSAPKAATALSYSGLTTVKAGATLTLSATLTASSAGLPAQRISFLFNKVTYSALTDSNGVASVSLKAPTKIGTYAVNAQFAAVTGYSASTTSATIAVTR